MARLHEGWNRVTAAKGGVLRDRAEPKPTIPDCQGMDARWDTKEHAEYIADQLRREFRTKWQVFEHRDHFHVREV